MKSHLHPSRRLCALALTLALSLSLLLPAAAETASSPDSAAALTPQQETLLEQETALLALYEARLDETTTADFGGVDWTKDEVLAAGSKMDHATAQSICKAIDIARNESLASILVALIPVRNQLAQTYGYANYADYSYDTLYGGRDTAQQAQTLPPLVIDQFSELHTQLSLVLAFWDQPTDTAWIEAAETLLAAAINNSMYDEFQQTIYGEGTSSVAELNAAFYALVKKYHCTDDYPAIDGQSYTWTEMASLVVTPFREIGTSLSATSALIILIDEERDDSAAIDAYEKMLLHPGSVDFSTFEESTLVFISTGIEDYMDELIPCVSFPDTTSHWSAPFVRTMSRMGAFERIASGNTLSPDQAATRGETVSMIDQILDTPVDSSYSYTDVPANHALAPAVNWATDHGYMVGYGNQVFGLNDSITREQAALFFYNIATSWGSPNEIDNLKDFSDGDDTSDWAEDAMGWAVTSGLFTGRPDGTLDPNGTITRGELCAVTIGFLTNFM